MVTPLPPRDPVFLQNVPKPQPGVRRFFSYARIPVSTFARPGTLFLNRRTLFLFPGDITKELWWDSPCNVVCNLGSLRGFKLVCLKNKKEEAAITKSRSK